MRLGEGFLVLINGLLLAQAVTHRPILSRRAARWVSGIGAVITLLHLIAEGYRWQMLPIYVLIGAVMLPRLKQTGDDAHLLMKTGIAGWALLCAGIVLLIVLPVPRLPVPSGPYAIGTVSYEWTDMSRKETYGAAPGGDRRIMAQIWYPAEKPPGALRQPWLESVKIAQAMARFDHLPAFLLDQVKLTRSHAFLDAVFVNDTSPYPVILYIHGWGGFRNINQDQIEALVSNGYVVVSADHTYGALITLFPDGESALIDPQALNGDGTELGKDTASSLLVHTFADDASFMLDQVAQLNQNDPDARFTGRLDIARVGVFGHSTGGGAAMQVCADDSRCAAVLGMDTWVEPVDDRVIQNGLAQPLMVLNSESWKSKPNSARLRQLYETSSATCYWLDIANTMHYDFVLVPNFSPIAHILGFSGSLPAKEIMTINETYLVAFFDRYLRDQDVPWLDNPPVDMDAVSFERR
jgi:predicted dienelactone hydrolase